MDVEESNGREPEAPQNNAGHALYVDDAEDEDKLVKYKVPELVLNRVEFGDTQLAKDLLLQPVAEQD